MFKSNAQTYFSSIPGFIGEKTIFDYGFCLNSTFGDSNEINNIFPNMTLTFHGVQVILQASDYLRLNIINNENYWCLGILDGGNTSMVILGDTFMRAFSVIFDRANSRIGFIGKEGTVNSIPDDSKSKWPIPFWSVLVIGNVAVVFIGIIISILAVRVYRRKRNVKQSITIEDVRTGSIEDQLSDYDDDESSNNSIVSTSSEEAKF